MKRLSTSLWAIIAIVAAFVIIAVVPVVSVRSKTLSQLTSTRLTSSGGSLSNGRVGEPNGILSRSANTISSSIYLPLIISDRAPIQTEPYGGSEISVETDKQEYEPDEEIVVTATNELETNITTFDQQAFCTIIKLEQQDNSEWEEVRNCLSAVPNTLVTLEPHTETVVRLPSLSPGIYRASIVFSLGDTFSFGDLFVVSSPPFIISDRAPIQTEPYGGSEISVETDKQEYEPDEEIAVMVTNELETNITTFDQQAFCTIIKLEQQDNSEWEEVRNCLAGVPSTLVTLEPHTETVVRLPSLSPGIYRASIIYSLGDTFSFGNSLVVSSPPFGVQ